MLTPAPRTPSSTPYYIDTTAIADELDVDTKTSPAPPVTDNKDCYIMAPRAEGHLRECLASYSHNTWAPEQRT